jgi:hypothetical protein
MFTSIPLAPGIDGARLAEATSTLVALAESTPLGVRGFAAVGGVVLILLGARFYRLAVAAPGAILGVLLATHLMAGMDDMTRTIAAIAAAVVGAMITGFIEKLATRLAGGLVGAFFTDALWPLFQTAEMPLWVPAAGALVGLLIFPVFWRTALKIITPFLGSLCVAYAVGHPTHPVIIIGLTALGALIQLKAFSKDEE